MKDMKKKSVKSTKNNSKKVLKQVRENNNKKVLKETSMSPEVKQAIIILISVIVICLLVYFVTAIVKGEIKFGSSKKETPETEIQYQEILAGETFNKPDSTYYVLFMNFQDAKLTPLMSLVDTYTSKENASYVYYVDLEKGFNTPFATTEESNKDVTAAKDLKVKSPTLIKISNKQNVEYIEGYDLIEETLTNLAK